MAFNRDKALAAAAKFAAKGQHDRAAKEYASVVEADPSDIRSWLLLADALKLMGDTAGAIERFLHVGKHYTDAGEHQKALAVYRQVLQIDAARLDVQGKVAGLYKDLGRTQDAIAAYEFVAQAHFQAGQIAEGLEGFRMVAELDPGAVGKRLRLAELYSREGMVPQAVEHFRLAADKLFNDRRLDDYIRVAERLIYHKEDDLPVLRSLARIYLSQNENRRALVKLNALLRSAPADPEGLELLADTFVALGKQDKAVSVLQELAREQRKGGRKAKVLAARVLKKAIALGPENAEDLKKIAADIDAEIAALPADPKEQTEDVDLDVDVVEEEAPGGGGDLDLDVEVEDVPSRPFAGVGANLAPSAAEQPEDNVGDTDKLLLEVRVYVKYKMHEHALGHLDSIFVRDPNNVTALELQASIFETLDRGAEAADTYVRLAQLTAARDAKLAREQIERALKLAPNHTKAEMVLAALDSGNGVASDQVAPLVRGLKDPARFDGGADTSGTRPISVAEPTDASPQQPEAANDVAPKTGPNEQAAAAETSAAKPAPTETSAAKAVEPVAAETSAAKPAPTETSAAKPEPTATETSSAKAVEPVATETSAAKAAPTETSAAKAAPTETSAATAAPTETSVAKSAPTETSAAKDIEPTPTETSTAKAIERTATETSVAKSAPTETSAAKVVPTETSTAKAIEPTPTETSVAKPAPTETSAAKPAPTETSAAKPAPTETSVAKAVEAVREDSGLKTLSPRGDDGERIESAAGKTPLPGPLPTRVTEKTPLPRLPSEKTPLPVFKPPLGKKPAEAASKPAEGKAPSFRPPTPSREPQEEVVEELDEVEEFEAVEAEPEPVRPAPPKKTPPKPAAAPPQRPGKPPPPKSAPPPKKPTTRPAPASEDSAAKAAPSEVSEAKPVSEDSTAKAAPSEVSEAKPVSEDSTAKAAPSEVSEAKPVSEDSTAKAAPSEVSEAKPVSEDSTAKAAPSEPAPEPVSEDSTAKAEPSEPAPEPVSEDSTKPAEPAEPVEAKPASEAVEEPAEPVSKDSTPAATPEAAPEAVPQDSTKPAEPEPPSEAKAEPVATTQPDVTETAKPAEASAPEAVPEDSAAKTLEAAPAQPEPEAAAAAQPEPAPTDSSTEPVAQPVVASEPASEKIEWPVIDDEVEELRFFIASRFEDDAQFTYLELQRRFPGHPALAEFADRFSTGAKLESAAAPVVVVDDAPATPAPSEVAPAAPQFEDEDEDFFSSIFDEPAAAPAPSRKTGPQRAVATLDEQADAQTLFDLGMAYHEMGLIDDALTQFGLAAGDRRWTSRANVMIADLRILRGEPDAAIGALEEAIAAASDDDERDAARYRLAEIFATVGNLAAAASTLRLITPGYRERDALLAQYDETA